jgi:ankyrin repeat protein
MVWFIMINDGYPFVFYGVLIVMRVKLTVVILLPLFISSCATTGVGVYNKNNRPSKITDRETVLVKQKVRNLPECNFLAFDISRIKPGRITQCMDRVNILVDNFSEDLRNKYSNRFLDLFLANELFPYLEKSSATELKQVLNHVAESSYPGNPKFIKWLIDKGVPTKDIVLVAPDSKESCQVNKLILEKNRELYLDDKYLNSSLGRDHISPRNLLFYLVANTNQTPCPDVIMILIAINPDLRNYQNDFGSTPLHHYMESYRDGIFDSINLAKKLITPKNINIQNKLGQTPLHMYLVNKMYVQIHDPLRMRDINMIKTMLQSGANIEIKDNRGISIKEIMKASPQLAKLIH